MRLLRLLARIWTIILGSTATLLALAYAARLLLPLVPLEPAPALITTMPQQGAEDVLPRSIITLSFAGPMNRSTTLRALRLDPPTAGQWRWSADARTLSFTPADTLTPATSYTVELAPTARDRWWRPLPETRTLSFQTAPQPAVLSALPNSVATPRESSFAIIFSQPMVETFDLNRDLTLPELSFTPAVPYRASWIAVDTLLIRPLAPLPAAQPYVATVAADLTDARGIELETPFTWRFSTAWPTISERTPPPGARAVGPRSPLSFVFDAPVDPALIRSTLTINPPIPGDLGIEPRGNAQVVTFTPTGNWAPETTYSVSLVPPAGSQLADPPDLRWRFTTEAEPGLAAFFPGQGQLLPAEQAIRLVFTTPMDAETLAAGITFDPPVDAVPITVSTTEARLAPRLAPSTSYTITVAAGTPDRSGTPIANDIVVGLRTAAAAPALSAPAAAVGVMTLPISQTASVDFARINLTAIDFTLYALDLPTLRLALAGGTADLAAFNPARYGQAQLRRWRVDLTDPPDMLVRSTVPITVTDADPLAPGAYLLQAVADAGPRVDLLLIVTDVQLTLRHNENQVLVWATGSTDGLPRAGLPINVYASDLLVASGTTDSDGIFELPLRRTPAAARYLAISALPSLAVVRADWTLDGPAVVAPAGYQALIWPDQLDYAPGAAVRVGGRVRRLTAGGELALPGSLPCRLQLLAAGAPPPPGLNDPACRITTDGRLTATAQINPDTLPGAYRLRVSIADTAIESPLRISAADTFGTTLDVLGTAANQITLRAASGGLPLAGAPLNWTVALSPLPPPVADRADGFQFAAPNGDLAPLTGSGVTDAAGRITIDIAGDRDQLLSYRLTATLNAPGASSAQLVTDGLIAPPDRFQVGIRLPNRVLSTTARAEVELRIRDAAGNPVAGSAVDLTVTRVAGAAGPPLLTRRVVSDADGTATVQLVQLNPGAYLISAAAGGAPAQTTLWVTAPNYSAWDNPPGQVAVITDRPQYAVGDTARVLITSPWPTATLLLSRERGVLRAAEVQQLNAGSVITFTVTPDLAPGFALGAILTNADARRVGSTTVAVAPGEPPLELSVASDRPSYLPGATATISVTLPTAVSAADLLVTLESATLPDQTPDNGGIAPQAPPPLAVAGHPPDGTTVRPTTITYRTGPTGFLVSGDVGAGGPGLATLQVPLPRQPGPWRISVYALEGVARVGRASTTVSVSDPLISTLLAPPAVRPGDNAELMLELTNTVPVTRSLQVDLELQGATLTTPAADDQQLLLASGSRQTLTWQFTPDPTATSVVARVRLNDGASTTLEQVIPVLPTALSGPFRSVSTWASGPLEWDLPVEPRLTEALEIALAPSLPATLADSAAQFSAAGERSIADQAAHLFIAARLGAVNANPDAAAWREQARRVSADLLSRQNNDGGWGWWPDTPSDPFISAFAVEALAVHRSLFGGAARPDPRAGAYLERQAVDAEPNLRAYIAYVAARSGQPLPAAIDLSSSDLGPAGLAYLALALPPNAATEAVERLMALPGPPWAEPAGSRLPDNPAAVHAAVVEALRSRNPSAPQIVAAEQLLRTAWSVDGWGGPFSAARIAAAFPLNLPTGGGPRRIALNEQPLISATTPFTSTVRLRIPAAQLRAPLILAVETSGAAPYLLAYRATTEPIVVRAPAAILTVTYHDPTTGTLVAPSRLRAGRLIEVRVQTLTTERIAGAQLTLDLPAALIPLEAALQGPFVHAQITPESAQVRFFAPNLEPGVSQQTILLRVAARGTFAAPSPQLIARDGADYGASIVLAVDHIQSR